VGWMYGGLGVWNFRLLRMGEHEWSFDGFGLDIRLVDGEILLQFLKPICLVIQLELNFKMSLFTCTH
jgi:hypothetical protein